MVNKRTSKAYSGRTLTFSLFVLAFWTLNRHPTSWARGGENLRQNCQPILSRKPCLPILNLQIKNKSLKKLLDSGIKIAKEKISAEIIGKTIGNPTQDGDIISDRTIPPLTHPDPEKCKNQEDWRKLGPIEKWKHCPGIPEYLINHSQNAKNDTNLISSIRRWSKNVSDIFNPIPANIDLKNLSIEDLELGEVYLEKVSTKKLAAEGENPLQLEYELSIPVHYLNVKTGLTATGAGFAQGRSLIDIKKMSVIMDARKLATSPQTSPAMIRLRFVVGKDGQLTQFKFLTPRDKKVSHLSFPLSTAFVSYANVNQPIRGDSLSDQNLPPQIVDQVKSDFGSAEDADNFTWFANFLNHNPAAKSLKSLLNSRLEKLIEDEVFPVLKEKIESTISRYTHPQTESIIDVSTFRVSRQIDAAKSHQRNTELDAIESQILNYFDKPESSESKKISRHIQTHLEKLKEHLKIDSDRVDSQVLEVNQHRLAKTIEIIKEGRRFLETHPSKDVQVFLQELHEILPQLYQLSSKISEEVEKQYLKYQIEVIAKTIDGVHRRFNLSLTDRTSPENQDCEPVENSVSAEVPKGSDGRLQMSISGINEKLAALHKIGFFDFCYNHNEIRDCSRQKVTDLAADVSFQNPPSIQWDPNKKSHYIDLSQLHINPKGLASLGGILIPKALNARVYITPKICSKNEKNSICIDSEIAGKVTSSDRGIIDKLISQIQLGTEIEPAVIEKVISRYAPKLQSEIQNHPIQTDLIEFQNVTRTPETMSIDFKLK